MGFKIQTFGDGWDLSGGLYTVEYFLHARNAKYHCPFMFEQLTKLCFRFKDKLEISAQLLSATCYPELGQ